MKTSVRLTLGIFALSVSLAARVQALDFDFSFQNTIGNVSGTVTGEIFGLSDNSTGPASAVLIDSFPGGLNNIAGPTPINAMLWDQQIENSFTVAGGEVVGGGFWAQQTVAGFPQGFQLYVDGGDGPFNFLNLDGTDNLFVWGDNGLAAANIVPAQGVPDSGSTLSLLGMAVAGFGMLRRKTIA